MVLNIISFASQLFVCLLWKNVYLSLPPIFFLIFLNCYINCLYILDINPLLLTSLANILSYIIGWLFILLMVSFAVQKLLTVITTHLFTFAFISLAFRDRSKKILLWFVSKSVLLILSSKSFMVSTLIARSLIPFQFTSVYSVREYTDLILWELHIEEWD